MNSQKSDSENPKSESKDDSEEPSEKKEAERRGSKTFAGRGTEKQG